jgi:hypothetical protein
MSASGMTSFQQWSSNLSMEVMQISCSAFRAGRPPSQI